MTTAGAGTVPLAQAIDEYLDWLALDKGRSPNTVRAYRADLNIFLTWCAGTEVTRLDQVDRELLRAYQRDLAHGPETAQGAGPGHPAPAARGAPFPVSVLRPRGMDDR